jgi:hypothetical protein
MSGTKSKTKCSACGKRIRDHEPDLVLRNAGEENPRPRYFHTRCGGAALDVVASAIVPAVWRLSVRHVEGGAN